MIAPAPIPDGGAPDGTVVQAPARLQDLVTDAHDHDAVAELRRRLVEGRLRIVVVDERSGASPR